MSQTELGAIGGVQKNAQHNYEASKRLPDADYLAAIGMAGVDILYVLTGERAADTTAQAQLQIQSSPPLHASDFAPIPVFAADLAAGNGSENGDDELVDHLAFRTAWLRSQGINPARAVIARAAGDSMKPTIQDRDLLLIDRAHAAPPAKVREAGDTRPARIYALLDGGAARVKRLDLAAPGLLALLSDNPEIANEIRPVQDVTIIGRVVWWGHTYRE